MSLVPTVDSSDFKVQKSGVIIYFRGTNVNVYRIIQLKCRRNNYSKIMHPIISHIFITLHKIFMTYNYTLHLQLNLSCSGHKRGMVISVSSVQLIWSVWKRETFDSNTYMVVSRSNDLHCIGVRPRLSWRPFPGSNNCQYSLLDPLQLPLITIKLLILHVDM